MPGDQTLENPGEPLRLVRGINTTAELFDVLGARPFLGRTFQAGEDLEHAAPASVISYGLWQELGGDASIIGRQLRLGGDARTIVGVMPRGFWFPSPTIRVWNAAPLSPEQRSGNWTLVGRVATARASRTCRRRSPRSQRSSGATTSTRRTGTRRKRRR